MYGTYDHAFQSLPDAWGCITLYSSDTTKYLIHIHLEAEGVVEKPDVVGAIFGQTEGLLGEDLDLRDLQRTGRVGRIDVQVSSKKGETKGEIFIASSLDRAETAILAASLETIDRVGPCIAHVTEKRLSTGQKSCSLIPSRKGLSIVTSFSTRCVKAYALKRSAQ